MNPNKKDHKENRTMMKCKMKSCAHKVSISKQANKQASVPIACSTALAFYIIALAYKSFHCLGKTHGTQTMARTTMHVECCSIVALSQTLSLS